MAGPPMTEGSVEELLDELEPGSPVSEDAWADGGAAEPPVEAPDSSEVVAGGEDGVLGLSSVADSPHPPGQL